MAKLTIHEEFLRRFPESDVEAAVSGHYDYYHYLLDGVDDRGWGCGYRTLQTLTSWIIHNAKSLQKPHVAYEVPSISRIQETIEKYDDTKSEQVGRFAGIHSMAALARLVKENFSAKGNSPLLARCPAVCRI